MADSPVNTVNPVNKEDPGNNDTQDKRLSENETIRYTPEEMKLLQEKMKEAAPKK
ncbi:MAG: hypothetical protein H7843_04050 [Nitrospirota bacterium]